MMVERVYKLDWLVVEYPHLSRLLCLNLLVYLNLCMCVLVVCNHTLNSMSVHPTHYYIDVNAPAMAEFYSRADLRQKTSCAYITVGTGVGVGTLLSFTQSVSQC